MHARMSLEFPTFLDLTGKKCGFHLLKGSTKRDHPWMEMPQGYINYIMNLSLRRMNQLHIISTSAVHTLAHLKPRLAQKIPWMIQVSFALAPAPHKRQTICSWPFLEATCSNKRLVVSIRCSACGSSSQRTSTMSPFPHKTCMVIVLSHVNRHNSKYMIHDHEQSWHLKQWQHHDLWGETLSLHQNWWTSRMELPDTGQKRY